MAHKHKTHHTLSDGLSLYPIYTVAHKGGTILFADGFEWICDDLCPGAMMIALGNTGETK